MAVLPLICAGSIDPGAESVKRATLARFDCDASDAAVLRTVKMR